MRFLIALAFKNLLRYGKRTVITASAIAFGLGLYIMLDSFLLGMEKESEINLINYETASAKVLHPDYYAERETLPLKYPLENPEAIITQLGELGIPAAPRIMFRGELFVRQDPYPEDGSLYIKGIAVDPERDNQVFKLGETLIAGRWLESDENGVLLGSWLAEDLGAEVGFPLTIRTRTRYGAYETMDLEVVGILNVPNPVVNRAAVILPVGTADYYLDMDGAVSEIALNFSRNLNPDREADRIAAELADGVEVRSWRELAPDYVAMAAMKSSGSNSILFLVILIATVGITNTMLMAVYERIRELGMMRAMGMSASQIRLTFIFEAAGIGLIGSVIGVIFGVLINWPLVRWGLDYSEMMRELDVGYRITSIFRSTWNPATIATAFAAGILIAAAVSLIPIRRALRMEITECLRND